MPWIQTRLTTLLTAGNRDPRLPIPVLGTGGCPRSNRCPNPSRELTVPADESRSLYGLEPGVSATFVRVSDSDPAMLRFLSGRGIAPGAELEVVDRQPFDGPLYVRVGDDVHVLGAVLARAMRVAV